MNRRLVLLPVLVAFLVGAAPATAWTWPVDGPVVRHFQLGGDPYAAGQHRGVDIGAAFGTAVRAPAGGRVTFAGTVPRAGRTVTIETSDGYSVTLLHLGSILVARDASLVEGETVGTVGATGDVEHPQPYVHLGVRLAGEPNGYLDPLGFLPPRAEGAAGTAAGPQEPAGAVAAGGELAEPEPAGDESAPPTDEAAPSPAPAAPGEPATAPPPSQPVDAPVPAPPVEAPVPAPPVEASVPAPLPPSAAAGSGISSPGTEGPAPSSTVEGAHTVAGGSAAAETAAPGTVTPTAVSGGSARDEGSSGRRRQAARAPTEDSARSLRPASAAAGRRRPAHGDGATASAVAAHAEAPRSSAEAGAADPAPSDTLGGGGGSPGWSLLLSAGLIALGTLVLRRRPGPGSPPDPPAPGPAPAAASGHGEPAAPAPRAARLESVDDLARAA